MAVNTGASRPNMVQEFVGTIMLVVHTSDSPSDPEWERYIAGLASMKDLNALRSIVFTDGGAPNLSQRRALNDFLADRQVLGAVVSHSHLVRGVVTALRWYNPKIRAFSPREIQTAFDYVGVRPEELDPVWETVERLRARLDHPNLRALPYRTADARK